MAEWMASADLLISKPGGMTSAEAMVCHLPMVIYDPIPGQEERNSDQLLENGVAIKCNEIMTLGYKVGALLSNPERLQRMKGSARRMGRPKAAETVVRTLLAESDNAPVEVNTDQQEEMAEQVRKR
jgi:processive 1,2-diacylglycerol beta-glucosyltransferase